jgi:hypothetical protein
MKSLALDQHSSLVCICNEDVEIKNITTFGLYYKHFKNVIYVEMTVQFYSQYYKTINYNNKVCSA